MRETPEHLKTERLKRGLALSEIARRADLRVGLLRAFETGNLSVPGSTAKVESIARAYRDALQAGLNGSSEQKESRDPASVRASPEKEGSGMLPLSESPSTDKSPAEEPIGLPEEREEEKRDAHTPGPQADAERALETSGRAESPLIAAAQKAAVERRKTFPRALKHVLLVAVVLLTAAVGVSLLQSQWTVKKNPPPETFEEPRAPAPLREEPPLDMPETSLPGEEGPGHDEGVGKETGEQHTATEPQQEAIEPPGPISPEDIAPAEPDAGQKADQPAVVPDGELERFSPPPPIAAPEPPPADIPQEVPPTLERDIPAAKHSLEVVALEKCWIKVTIDNRRGESLILKPGDRREWKADKRIRIVLGNAGGVLMKWDGQPLGPVGKSGQVVQFVMPNPALMRVPAPPDSTG